MIDITGQKFNKLTAIKFDCIIKNRYYWIFNCEYCGNDKSIIKENVISGTSKSCGCQRGKGKNNNKYRHGMSKTRFHNIWKSMIGRCRNKNDKRIYDCYRGRGIKVCDSWLKFENFYEDMYQPYLKSVKISGEKQTTIDRIENNLGYYKENCRWANFEIQQNNKRSNKLLTYKNETLTIAQWSKKLNLKSGVLYSRIFTYNWSVEKALTMVAIPKNDVVYITYKGKTMNILQWSKELNIKSDTLYNRIHRLKWSAEKAMGTSVKKPLLTFEGQTMTISQWAKYLNISCGALGNRIRKKCPLNEALNPQNYIKEHISYNGKVMTIKDWAKEINISYKTLYERIKYLDWTIEEAIETPVRRY